MSGASMVAPITSANPPAVPSALDAPLVVTFFEDAEARTKTERTTTLRELVPLLRDTSAPSKAALPWLKLATFGDARTERGSLRNNANVRAIHGVEGDYDGEAITLDRACQIVAQAGIAAIIYTSPRHAPEAPRWRILCPLSGPMEPDGRAGLLARVNGLFVGALSGESFTLSQSYYFGHVDGAAHHEVRAIDGRALDLADELDADAIGKPSRPKPEAPAAVPGAPRSISSGDGTPWGLAALDAECTALLNAPDGEKHRTLNRAAFSIAGLVAAGELAEGPALSALHAALAGIRSRCADFAAAERTLADAWAAGLARPRAAPPPLPAPARREVVPPEPPPHPEPPEPRMTARQSAEAWAAPVDFLADERLTGAPALAADHIPPALAPFVFDTAGRMGVDPAAVALAALVSCAAVMSDAWVLQPKQHDDDWTEQARIWGAIVGDPSIRKTPVMGACTRPIERMEAEAREQHAEDIRAHRAAEAAWKAAGSDPGAMPIAPRLRRYMVEGTTIEALTEILRDDAEAKQIAPAGKLLVRQDEMSEWVGNLDRYRAGGKGGGDRGAYLRLYNGGRFTVDRIGRGSFAVPNWSACFIGGIQPDPIRRIARDAADDGLLQRFLFIVPTHQAEGEDRAPNRAALARYAALFPALANLHPPGRIPGSPRPRVVLHAGAHQHRKALDAITRRIAALPDTSKRLVSALGKWPGTFARLALVFHLIDLADASAQGTSAPPHMVLSEATAARAAAFLRDIALPHLLRADAVMFSTEQTSHAAWIAGHILATPRERIAVRDIVRSYRALRAPEQRQELMAVMEGLVSFGWIEPEEPPPGRPVTTWRVNPAIYSTFAARAEAERQRREALRAEVAAFARTYYRAA